MFKFWNGGGIIDIVPNSPNFKTKIIMKVSKNSCYQALINITNVLIYFWIDYKP